MKSLVPKIAFAIFLLPSFCLANSFHDISLTTAIDISRAIMVGTISRVQVVDIGNHVIPEDITLVHFDDVEYINKSGRHASRRPARLLFKHPSYMENIEIIKNPNGRERKPMLPFQWAVGDRIFVFLTGNNHADNPIVYGDSLISYLKVNDDGTLTNRMGHSVVGVRDDTLHARIPNGCSWDEVSQNGPLIEGEIIGDDGTVRALTHEELDDLVVMWPCPNGRGYFKRDAADPEHHMTITELTLFIQSRMGSDLSVADQEKHLAPVPVRSLSSVVRADRLDERYRKLMEKGVVLPERTMELFKAREYRRKNLGEIK